MIRINLLGREAEAQTKGLRGLALSDLGGSVHQIGIATMFLLTVAVVAFTWWHQGSLLEQLRNRTSTLQAERERLQEVADRIDALRERSDLLRRKLEVIVDLKVNQTGPVMLLDQVSRRLADGVWLTRLQLEGGDVTLNGEGLSEVAVADYVRNLERSPYFTDVFLRTLGDTGEALSFQINLRFDPLASRALPAEEAARES